MSLFPEHWWGTHAKEVIRDLAAPEAAFREAYAAFQKVRPEVPAQVRGVLFRVGLVTGPVNTAVRRAVIREVVGSEE